MAVRDYYHLTKPGIIYGNALPLVAGFFVASRCQLSWVLLAVLIGQSLVIAGACVWNNYIDRSIDGRMQRTQRRAFVNGTITPLAGLVYASVLTTLGVSVLAYFVNGLTAILGIIGFVVYVGLYGYTKRRGPFGTLIGGVAGALPPVAGYCAVTGRLDLTTVALFGIMMAWQLPHFYAIALFRLEDYRAAGIPVLPVRRGVAPTQWQIILWTVIFMIAAASLTYIGTTGWLYLIAIIMISLWWLQITARPRQTPQWSRAVFKRSLVVLLLLCICLPLGVLAP